MKNFYEVFQYRLIYVYAIPDAAHRGLLKIGETTISTDLPVKKLAPNSSELNAAANKRIKKSTNTPGIAFKLMHTELAVTDSGKAFGDRAVHLVLKNSGIEKVTLEGTTAREWFRIDLATAKRAIQAVKRDKNFIRVSLKKIREEIVLRPEQEEAVSKTVAYFQHGKEFLWNAKMRFGKTLCALEVVQAMNFAKTIIITHRPAVEKNWFTEYKNVFRDDRNFIYGSKKRGSTLKTLRASKKHFIYFASMQDLRGSKDFKNDDDTTDKFDKNHEVFGETWDCIIVDEGHEGTQTPIGKNVIKALSKRKTKILWLSGTPFNLVDDFTDENSFAWDYIREQDAKFNWYLEHGDDPNPYVDLPKMHIYTYNLGELLGKRFSDDEDVIFSLNEFFRTNDKGKFVYEADIKRFLDLLVKDDDNNYPFANEEFRDMFRHTLWRIPGVKAGRALSKLLQRHPVFGFDRFKIVNIAGDGDEDIPYKDALKLVETAIAENPYTITLSCGKLTAGVTVPEWTAVLYLSGNYMTSATSYLQTIFRVQNPCNVGGSKQNAYVFDFAPDRALKMVTEFVKVSTGAGKATDSDRDRLDDLLTFCPVIAVEGSEMKPLDAKNLLQRIKHAQAERIVAKGFADNSLYNEDTLLNLTDDDWQVLNGIKKAVGTSKDPTDIVSVNEQGVKGKKPASKSARTPEQKALDKKKDDRRKAISILRQVSIRMPLLIYGADVPLNEDFKLKMFLDKDVIDDDSWAEFMPAGFTRKMFEDIIKHYDPENFINSGSLVRKRAKDADKLTPTERVKEIADIFSKFKNPDKETVLTPWRVVNLHMTEVFGGWNFFAKDNPPQFVPTEIFRPDKKILEINSKTGLYPLFVAYSIYRARLDPLGGEKISLEAQQKIWDKTVAENVFVICKTKMAETITRRTLMGYRDEKIANAECYDNLIDTLKTNPEDFVKRITNKNFWFKGGGKMFFDVVVGNPPYQISGSGDNKTFSASVYNLFMENSFKLAEKVSLITPARFLFNAGATPQDFRNRMLSDPHLKVVRYEDDGRNFFPTSEIKGGIVITLRDAKKIIGPIGTFFAFDELRSIHHKVCVADKKFRSLNEIMRGQMTYKLSTKAYEDFPDLSSRLPNRTDTALRTNAFEVMPDIFLDAVPNDGREYVQIYGLFKMKRVCRYVRREYMIDIPEFETYKVFMTAADGNGDFGEKLTDPLVFGKGIGATQTFITVGAFDTRDEAEACLKYIKTKFVRALRSILKVTQHNPPPKWAKVPLQNFTASSDIDWTKSVAQIDAELYRKYGLTDAEKNFIETHVKEMA